MKLSIFLPLAAFLSMTAAEITITNENFSPCLVDASQPISPRTRHVLNILQNQCLSEGAAVAGCASQFDTDCTCTSPAFKDTVKMCLEYACTAEDAERKIDFTLGYLVLVAPADNLNVYSGGKGT